MLPARAHSWLTCLTLAYTQPTLVRIKELIKEWLFFWPIHTTAVPPKVELGLEPNDKGLHPQRI
jgi:hypothetical protein